ncbi:FAD-binding oxidoreductase [Ciceribacter sp. L1K22]|uniref:NAD(P)/FAD-dependent oxidoreductase n=1 Tax=Ciceribacter sp. L1K22 TaxID=2820275 RepID=UPI001ABDC5A0|nr:FAD-binding oxidoreductase [Ciceribacter sp. L1K22]MBO3761442.1 FAD-binding oxidoreductase [Ciceribacter sp. L1K22]
MLSRPPSSVIVVGSGIVGAATAYFLAERGIDVRLLDTSAPAAEATGAADGAVSVASKRPGPIMTAALKGVALYGKLADKGLFAGAFKRRSTFIVAISEEECAVLDAHSAALASAGVKVEILHGVALSRKSPALSPRARMAVEVHGEGHAIGYQIVHRLLSASGIVVDRNTSVEGLSLVNGGKRIGAVVTSRGELRADAVVIAAGNGSARLLGLGDVLTQRKGQLLVTERAPALNGSLPGAIMSGRYLLSKGSQKSTHTPPPRGLGLVIDPLVTGQFLIGGTREDSGSRETTDIDAVSRMLADAVDLVPGLSGVRLLRSFAGVRTAVADGLPIVGQIPGLENGFVATGFEGDGICLGPIAGKSLVQLMCGDEPDLRLSSFDPGRFADCGVAA